MSSGSRRFLAACIQLCSGVNQPDNLARTAALIRRAAGHGAQLICTPENTPFLGPTYHKISSAEFTEGAAHTGPGSLVHFFSSLASELRVHLLVGSLTEAVLTSEGEKSAERCHNTSLLYGPDGSLLARYRKIHLFDVDVPGGPSFKESGFVAGGDAVVVCDTSVGRIGLSICYDLRFPELYARLVEAGAEVICVPSAFTAKTGKDHWRPLLQARAIETQSWVLAPNQWGAHDEKGARQSHGHSMIVDPWGCVVADAGDGEGVAMAEIDLDRVQQVRTAIPVQSHRKL